MRTFVIALVLVALGMSSPALANDNLDNVGVFFDHYGSEMCVNYLEGYGIGLHHVYVVLYHLTSPAVRGFELQLAFDGPLLPMNFAFPAGAAAINVQNPPAFMVGFGNAVPAQNWMVTVMEFDIFVYSMNPADYDEYADANVYVREIFFHSLPWEAPAYLDENLDIKPLHYATGDAADPVMIFSLDYTGCMTPFATEKTSWDRLKGMFR